MKLKSWKIFSDIAQSGCIMVAGCRPMDVAPLVSAGVVMRDGRKYVLTEHGKAAFSGKAPVRCIDATWGDLGMRPVKDPHEWEKRVCARFFAELGRNCPMKGSPGMTDACIDALDKLRRLDGHSRREIRDVLEFIVRDVSDGFCLARNIRTPATLRAKWKNGMTKFDTALARMRESESASARAEAVFSPPFGDADPVHAKADRMWEELMESCPDHGRPAEEYARAASSAAMLFAEFVEDRGWAAAIFAEFPESAARRRDGLRLSGRSLVRDAADFLLQRGKSGGSGYYARRSGAPPEPDEDYPARIEDWVRDRGRPDFAPCGGIHGKD